MGLAQYQILPQEDEWGVLHDGDVKNRYATKEAAFEAAVARRPMAVSAGMVATLCRAHRWYRRGFSAAAVASCSTGLPSARTSASKPSPSVSASSSWS